MNPYDNFDAQLRVLAAPRRNQYFYGKRMDVQHFRMEQDYGKLKQWMLNRLSLGKGVMCGLKVSVDGERICVDPGVAIDGLGREIVVPVRACIDPLATGDGCCGQAAASPAPTPPNGPPAPTPSGTVTPAGVPDGAVVGAAGTPNSNPSNPTLYQPPPPTSVYEPGRGTVNPRAPAGLFTLWLCYRECAADYQPTLVSDCDSRDHCAAGTTVETFCLKVTPGLPALQGDPDWCANLWPAHPDKPTPAQPNASDSFTAASSSNSNLHLHAVDSPYAAGAVTGLSLTEEERKAVLAARQSRRHLLCELFDDTCDAAETDPCVPLAIVMVRDGQIKVESCLVRPRIYSNTMLLDMILCLADKIDACCDGHPPAPQPPAPQPPAPEPPAPQPPTPVGLLRVLGIEFIRRNPNAQEELIATVTSPQDRTDVKINGRTNAIRIRFNRPVEQRATHLHRATTPALGDNNFRRHNVLVLPERPGGALPFVPGTLFWENTQTLRFDLALESLYSRGADGWQKGNYVIDLCGTDSTAETRFALLDANTASALDGDAITPTPGGPLSGDGVAGGDFKTRFTVGA